MLLNEHGTGGIARNIYCLSLASALLLCSTSGVSAKQRHSTKDAPQDQIEVAAHLPLTGGAITRFLTTEHYRRDYLYAEHELGKALTMIDVTNIKAPFVITDVSYSNGSAAQMVAVAGNAALVSTGDSAAPLTSSPQTFRIMSFADPLHPTVRQEFAGVTAMARDDKRGLIFLANSEGVWILQQQYAVDPQFEKEWEHMMLDNR